MVARLRATDYELPSQKLLVVEFFHRAFCFIHAEHLYEGKTLRGGQLQTQPALEGFCLRANAHRGRSKTRGEGTPRQGVFGTQARGQRREIKRASFEGLGRTTSPIFKPGESAA